MAGKYDNIKVYNGTAWKQPTEIKAYNGAAWKTLGAHTVGNSSQMYVYKNNEFVKATKAKYVWTDYEYKQGPYRLNYSNNSYYNWYPTGYNWAHYFNCRIQRVSNVDTLVFYSGDDLANRSGANYLKIVWLANGKIQFTVRYNNGTVQSTETTNAVTGSDWYYLSISTPGNKNGTITITWNGVSTTTTAAAFLGVNKQHQFGDANLRFRDTIYLSLADYYSGQKITTLSVPNKDMGATEVVQTIQWL